MPFIPPVEINDNIKLRIPSPSGKKVAILREDESASETNTKKKQVLELWTENGHLLQRRILLSDKLHGKVINDPTGFGGPSWNADETVLVYPAERIPPKTASFFDDDIADGEKATTGASAGSSVTVPRGATNTLGLGKPETWGEKYSSQSPLLDLYCVNMETGKVGKIDNVPDGHSADSTRPTTGMCTDTTQGGITLGQPVFCPWGDFVVYVGWDAGGGSEMPRRLGLVYCQQRPSKLYASSVHKLLERLASADTVLAKDPPEGYIVLTQDTKFSRSPRFSPRHENGDYRMVFLSCTKNVFDTHSGCFALQSMLWKDGKPDLASQSVVVDQVWDPRQSSSSQDEVAGLSFPGLFLQQLPDPCFVTTEYLLTTSQWGVCQKVIRIRLTDGAVSVVHCGTDKHNIDELLFVSRDGGAIISSRTPNKPASLHYLPMSQLVPGTTSGHREDLSLGNFLPIASTRWCPIPFSSNFDFSFDIDMCEAPRIDGVSLDLPIQSILMLPSKSSELKKPPLIVVPHGGPHSASTTNYLPSYAYLCGYGGYAILLVNYRGSTGYGQASIESLPTRIGALDVEDLVAATEKVMRSGLIDPDKIGICGGSHGGFLVGHCTAQYPAMFRVAAMRNPVVNIPSMTTTTDIPDWCYVEACGSYEWNKYRPATKEELVTMWDRSPIRHIAAVRAPTLVALGLKDLRVPPSQGMEWFYTLRSMGVPVKLLTYDKDDHAIDGVCSEADHWINTKKWFDEHLQP